MRPRIENRYCYGVDEDCSSFALESRVQMYELVEVYWGEPERAPHRRECRARSVCMVRPSPALRRSYTMHCAHSNIFRAVRTARCNVCVLHCASVQHCHVFGLYSREDTTSVTRSLHELMTLHSWTKRDSEGLPATIVLLYLKYFTSWICLATLG